MSDTKLNIAVAQMDCVVGETEPNLNKIRHFTELAARLGAELVIFPECATTGYFIGDKLGQARRGAGRADAPRRLADIARKNRIHLACGMFTAQGNGVFRNSQPLFSPEGKRLAVYNKAHLFSKEREFFKAGDKPRGGRHRASARSA